MVVVKVDALLPSHSLSSLYLKKVMENSLKNSIEAFPATTKQLPLKANPLTMKPPLALLTARLGHQSSKTRPFLTTPVTLPRLLLFQGFKVVIHELAVLFSCLYDSNSESGRVSFAAHQFFADLMHQLPSSFLPFSAAAGGIFWYLVMHWIRICNV